MTAKPTRATVEGVSAYLDLQAKARADNRSTEELLRLHALEGFLDRACSPRTAAPRSSWSSPRRREQTLLALLREEGLRFS